MKKIFRMIDALAVLIIFAILFSTGCRATMVSVTSDPPGAKVYSRGAGRMGYRWENKGNTPVAFPSKFNAQNTMVVWPDGTKSEIQYTELIGSERVEVHFTKNPLQKKMPPVSGDKAK